jgi:hypothetical protein
MSVDSRCASPPLALGLLANKMVLPLLACCNCKRILVRSRTDFSILKISCSTALKFFNLNQDFSNLVNVLLASVTNDMKKYDGEATIAIFDLQFCTTMFARGAMLYFIPVYGLLGTNLAPSEGS